MSSTFQIHFRPDAVKDYAHELICTSERERFIVPIRCIGSRGILDFPDFVNLEECPVKMNKPKTLLVRNVGTDVARFSLETDESFKVEPTFGELKIDEAMQITVEFQPTILGDSIGEMRINYDTGEEVFVSLQGVGVNLDVRLNQSELKIASTYIGMANFKTFVINNKGTDTVTFQFSEFSTKFEEEKERKVLIENINEDETNERYSIISIQLNPG